MPTTCWMNHPGCTYDADRHLPLNVRLLRWEALKWHRWDHPRPEMTERDNYLPQPKPMDFMPCSMDESKFESRRRESPAERERIDGADDDPKWRE